MTAKLKQIELDRNTWIRGDSDKNYGETFLLRHEDGHMCCMGFAAKAYGVDLDSIDRQMHQVFEIPDCPKALMTVEDQEEYDIYTINDTGSIGYENQNITIADDKQRVALLNKTLVEAKAPFRFFLKKGEVE